LSGGAARGMAHIGVLRVLEENGIPIDCIAGTSAGALVGGTYSAGLSIIELEALAYTMRWRDVGQMAFSRLGFQSSERMETFIRSHLPVKRFEELKIPFAAVATDLIKGEAVVMRDEGDVAFAIRASCNIPVVYVPAIDKEGRQLVDGGLVSIIPARYARAMGADIVIAVDVNFEGAKFIKSTPTTALGVMLHSFMIIQRNMSSFHLKEADLVICPKVGHLRWDEVSRAKEFIKLGEEATCEMIDEIKTVVNGEQTVKF